MEAQGHAALPQTACTAQIVLGTGLALGDWHMRLSEAEGDDPSHFSRPCVLLLPLQWARVRSTCALGLSIQPEKWDSLWQNRQTCCYSNTKLIKKISTKACISHGCSGHGVRARAAVGAGAAAVPAGAALRQRPPARRRHHPHHLVPRRQRLW